MRQRDRDSINALTPDNFRAFLHCQPAGTTWDCDDGSCCPLHDFIDGWTGLDLFVGGHYIAEHWAREEDYRKSMDSPRWMWKFVHALSDYDGSRISPIEVLRIMARYDGTHQ